MYKKIVISLTALLIISACNSGDEKEQINNSNSNKTSQAPKIKVTEGAVKKIATKEKSKENSGKFYYAYNKEKNSTHESNSSRRTTLDAYLNIHSPYERVRITLMIKKLSRDFIVKCSPCHDDYANGVIGPSLLGKDGNFIYNRILAFKSGKKKNVLMKELVAQMNDKQIRAIADDIAKFNKQIQEMRKGRK